MTTTRKTKLVSISVPPELFEQADRLARQEDRTRSGIFREALRRYVEADGKPLSANNQSAPRERKLASQSSWEQDFSDKQFAQ